MSAKLEDDVIFPGRREPCDVGGVVLAGGFRVLSEFGDVLPLGFSARGLL